MYDRMHAHKRTSGAMYPSVPVVPVISQGFKASSRATPKSAIFNLRFLSRSTFSVLISL